MNRYLRALLPLVVVAAGGCYWISGPWTEPQAIERKFNEKIKIGMLQADVEKELGQPSDTIHELDEGGRIPEGSRAAWLLYKYDYPNDPMLITIKVDYFGIVTEKHFDNKETVARLAEQRRTRDEKLSYPGAPQRRFQELEKKKRNEGL